MNLGKTRIRGGQWDETATYIDNFEIYEPYHFEEADALPAFLILTMQRHNNINRRILCKIHR